MRPYILTRAGYPLDSSSLLLSFTGRALLACIFCVHAAVAAVAYMQRHSAPGPEAGEHLCGPSVARFEDS